jgi:CHAT domain-containing protein
LTRGIDAYERLTLPSSHNRHKDLDSLFDRLIYLALRDDNVKAFEYSERYHGTFIMRPNKPRDAYPSRMAFGTTRTGQRIYSSKEFNDRFPRLTALVDYNVSVSTMSAWVFRNGSAKFINLGAIGWQNIEGSAKSYANHRAIMPRLSSTKLYNKLIQPIRLLLPNGGDLIILAPPSLKGVDFFHLQKTSASRTLDRDYNVSTIYKTASFSPHGQLPTALEVARTNLANDRIFDPLTVKTNVFSPFDRVKREIPKRTTILEYKLLKDRIIIWVIKNNKLDTYSASIDGRMLKSYAALWVGSIGQKSPDRAREISEILHGILIKPIERHLADTKDLVIVPDGPLAKIPFAALRSQSSGKFLIESYSLSYISSASLYLAQQERNPPRPNHSHWTVYALITPYSREQSANQISLSGPTSEAAAIKQIYPGSEIFSGREADGFHTPPASDRHEVLHYSGHWDPWNPTYDGSPNPDTLPIGDSTRLVVLSACSTTTERLGRRNYSLGIAQPILDRGVPAVVASLWEVHDLAASELLVHFYKYLRAGKDGANALRSAELDFLQGKNLDQRDPSKWAGFQFLGFGGI